MNPTRLASNKTTRGFTYFVDFTETTSIVTNKSTISYALKLSLDSGSSWGFGSYGIGWEMTVNGTQVAYHNRALSDRYTCWAGETLTLQSGSFEIEHNNDGTGTISVNATMDMADRPAGAGAMSFSGASTLTEIPRASSITNDPLTFVIGQATSIGISRASSSFTHTLSYSFANNSGNIGTGIATLKSWTPPSTWINDLPSAASGTGTITLTTYNGSTQIGDPKPYTATFTVNENIKPIIIAFSVTPYNANAWLSTKNAFVMGYSQINVSTTATAGTGSSLASYAYKVMSGALTEQIGSGSTWRSAIVQTSGSKNVSVVVTDKRGRQETDGENIDVLPYSPPSISELTYERGTLTNNVWTPNRQGNHIKATATAVVALSSLNNGCTITVTCNGTNKTISSTSGSVYFTNTDSEHAYTLRAVAVDSVGVTGAATEITVPTGAVPFFWGADRIGIGKIAEESGHAEFGYVADFDEGWTGGGIQFPDPNKGGKVLKMKADGSGAEWGDGGTGGASSYADLTGKPTIDGHTINSSNTAGDLGLAKLSDVPNSLSQLSDDSSHRTVTDTEKSTWNAKADASAVPTALSQLSQSASYRTVTDTEKSTWNSKMSDYTLSITTSGGGTFPVKFLTVNYSNETSETGFLARVNMVSGHGNGVSYKFLEEAILSVSYTGAISADVFRYYGASATWSGHTGQFGDVFWIHDATNKIVTFYVIVGQYGVVKMTPYYRLNNSSGGTVTQHTGSAIPYSSGTVVWGNSSDIAQLSDLANYLPLNSGWLYLSGGVPDNNSALANRGYVDGNDQYVLGIANAALPKTGGTISGNLNVTGQSTFTNRPTVGGTNVALTSDIGGSARVGSKAVFIGQTGSTGYAAGELWVGLYKNSSSEEDPTLSKYDILNVVFLITATSGNLKLSTDAVTYYPVYFGNGTSKPVPASMFTAGSGATFCFYGDRFGYIGMPMYDGSVT